MSIFDVYDQEFGALSKELSKNIGELRSYSDGLYATHTIAVLLVLTRTQRMTGPRV